jgi:hypothetical protein
MTVEGLDGEQKKCRCEPPGPLEHVPGEKQIDDQKGCVSHSRPAIAQRRMREGGSVKNGCGNEQESEDAKEGLARHRASAACDFEVGLSRDEVHDPAQRDCGADKQYKTIQAVTKHAEWGVALGDAEDDGSKEREQHHRGKMGGPEH